MTEKRDELRQAIDNLLDDRDHLFILLDTIDWDAQLDAIRDVLGRNRAAADAVASNIKVLEEGARTYRGPYQDHAVDEHVDAMYRSSYSDAAVSLSAVGMIVPMMESVLSQSFQSLGAMYAAKSMSPPDHQRWQRAGKDAQRWNCQWYFGATGPKTDIIRGIKQLSAASGLTTWLEQGAIDWITAMLSYRNRVFHGGFEWSLDQREQFEALIAEREWDRFFQSARTNDNP